MTTIWCRACGYGLDVYAGLLPDVCAGCQREALWSTEPPMDRLQDRWMLTPADERVLDLIARWHPRKPV